MEICCGPQYELTGDRGSSNCPREGGGGEAVASDAVASDDGGGDDVVVVAVECYHTNFLRRTSSKT